MERTNKKQFFIVVVYVSTLIVTIIGATFAYFTITVKYKTPPAEVEIKSSTMIIEYEAENNIKYEL